MVAEVRRDDALTTYRSLRIAMPILVVVLGASISYQIFAPTADDCWLGSISAYYYTSARAVFVASLCAIGTCLIVYKGGTTREDIALNVSGFMAFFVAFIPTPLAEVDEAAPACARSNVPSEAQLVAALDNNIVALLVGATVTVGVMAWFRRRTRRSGGPTAASPAAVYLTGAAVLAAWVVFTVDPELVRRCGHLAAAIALFAGIVGVVAVNSFTFSWLDAEAVAARPAYRRSYRVILVLMLLVVVVFGVLALCGVFDHAVFWLEAGVIALFAAYWVLQTLELWDVTHRVEHG